MELRMGDGGAHLLGEQLVLLLLRPQLCRGLLQSALELCEGAL